MAELENRSWIKSPPAGQSPRLARGARDCEFPRRKSAGSEPTPESVGGVIGRLVRSNVESLHLAKELLTAQEAADASAILAGLAIDTAAVADGDPQAIEAAMQAVAKANAADAREAEVSNAWSMHRLEVYELVTSAVQLLGSLPVDLV